MLQQYISHGAKYTLQTFTTWLTVSMSDLKVKHVLTLNFNYLL